MCSAKICKCELLLIFWQVKVKDQAQRSRLCNLYLYVSQKLESARSEIKHTPFSLYPWVQIKPLAQYRCLLRQFRTPWCRSTFLTDCPNI